MTFLGYNIRHTDAVYDTHIKAEGCTLFCGQTAFYKIVKIAYKLNLDVPDLYMMKRLNETIEASRKMSMNVLWL